MKYIEMLLTNADLILYNKWKKKFGERCLKWKKLLKR